MTHEEARAIVALIDEPTTVHCFDGGTFGEEENDPGGEWFETRDGRRISRSEADAARAMLAAADLLAQQQREQQTRSRPGRKPNPRTQDAFEFALGLVRECKSKDYAAAAAAEKFGVPFNTVRGLLRNR
jgi:hypothetical protein